MLSIKIYTDDDILEFDEEIADFAYTLKNADELPFNISMPIEYANILLHTKMPNLANVKQGHKLIVRNSASETIITLYVISVTILKYKGKTEIACSGKPLPDLVLGAGVYDLENMPLPETVKGATNRQSKPGFGIIENTEDLVLSHLWGGDRITHIAPAEFVEADRNYDFTTFEENDTSLPAITILPEHIIDYDVTSSRPAVTALVARDKVKGRVGSDLPVSQQVRAFTIEKGNLDAVYTIKCDEEGDNCSHSLIWSDGIVNNLLVGNRFNVIGIFSDSFVTLEPIQALQDTVSMTVQYGQQLLVANYKGTEIILPYQESYHTWSVLGWDDSQRFFTVERNPSVNDVATIAVYNSGYELWERTLDYGSVSYVVWGMSVTAMLKRIHRITEEVIATKTLNNADVYFPNLLATSDICITSKVGDQEFLWFNEVQFVYPELTMKLGLRKDSLHYIEMDISRYGALLDIPRFRFINTTHTSATHLYGLYATDYDSNVPWVTAFKFSIASYSDFANLETAGMFNETLSINGSPVPAAKPVDAFDTHARGGNGICLVYQGTRLIGSIEDPESTVVAYSTHFVIANSSLQSVVDVVSMKGDYRFLDSGDLSIPNCSVAPIVQLAPESLNDLLGDVSLEIKDSYYGDVIYSLGEKPYKLWSNLSMIVYWNRYRHISLYAFYRLEGNREDTQPVLFTSYVPWLHFEVGNTRIKYRLKRDVDNEVYLPFIVSDLNDISLPLEEEGRMTLDIAGFSYVTPLPSLLSKETTVQDLSFPPLMSYVDVYLQEGLPSPLKMKVTGIQLWYNGVVSLRLTGILVPLL